MRDEKGQSLLIWIRLNLADYRFQITGFRLQVAEEDIY